MGIFRDIGRRAEKLKQQVSDAAEDRARAECRECGTAVYTDRETCPECGSESLEAKADTGAAGESEGARDREGESERDREDQGDTDGDAVARESNGDAGGGQADEDDPENGTGEDSPAG